MPARVKTPVTDPEEVKFPSFSLNISQSHVNMAIPANSGHCMIAESLKEAFIARFGYKPQRVSVDLQTVRFTDTKNMVRFCYLTPKSAQQALARFDEGLPVRPFGCRLKDGTAVPAVKSPKGKKRKTKAVIKVSRSKKNVNRTETRTVVGGRLPPKAVLSGNRRQYGVRSLTLKYRDEE